MAKLSDTQRIILSQASQRDDGLATPPERLPAAARQTVARSLLKQGLVNDEDASAPTVRDAWQVDGRSRLLRITDAGLRAIGVTVDEPTVVDAAELGGLSEAEYEEEQALAQAALDAGLELCASRLDGAEAATPVKGGPQSNDPHLPILGQGESQAACLPSSPLDGAEVAQAPGRRPVRQREGLGRAAALRMAAAAVMGAWDVPEREGLEEAVAALRGALATMPGRASCEMDKPRQPRSGTKQETVLALLSRDEGATIAQVMETTGWQSHTVRGFLAGLKRKGIDVEVLERVRQVGPNKQGARGSYSIYCIAAAAPAEAG